MTNKRKKILFIHETLHGGGAEKVFVDLIRRFDRENYDVSLLLLKGIGVHMSSLPSWLRTLVLYKAKTSLVHKVRWHFRGSRDLMLKRDLNKILQDESFDTIVSFLEGPAMKAHYFIMERAKRNVSWVHVNLEVNHWTRYMFRNTAEEAAMYSEMDEIAFVSQGALDAFVHKFGVKRPMRVIPNVIDNEAIRLRANEEVIPTSKFTIINVGRLASQKRQDRLILTAKLLKAMGLDFEVWILGTGPMEQELKSMAKKEGVANEVKFLGFQTNPYTYIKAADMFLLTSDTEGWPTVICEALSLGCPVVSTRVTGSEELLGAGAGILTSKEPEEISKTVYELATSPDLLAEYADRAAERGRGFNPEEVLKQVYSII